MEQILKILKQLVGTAGALGNVPKPIKVAMTYFAVFVGVVVIFKYAKLSREDKTFLIIALLVLAVLTAGYYVWKNWMAKKHDDQFRGDISQHSAATPRGLSDPAQRARLDDMRKKFQTGIEAYKSRGKDLYKLPWYLIVGEPGSGKTEAIRHSNVPFPSNMHDEFQGVGGTINMNWWFTKPAVLLDTAGRLMFEEVSPGDTSEWKEFLTLLKKNRPNCPLNGLFLIIPSDSLIKDSGDDIQKKAGKISRQLDVIQRVLDVRFPVFVVVTKCDKINGFREFFDGLTDPQLQHQMMGWSNPAPLDEPFKPELVDKHLEEVSARLRRRRLGLLRDPVPENIDGRRTDEVDSLYALPHSLERLAPRLRCYLETIFVADEWSAKPLFLRGIYFSSSMREGAALDAELAEAIGVAVEDLPEGKVWERERAYFLRDLFLEKAFRENGLVTRASNTKRMLRSQQIALYSFGFVSLAVLATVAWFAKGDLRTRVKAQADHWHMVSEVGFENKTWKRGLVPLRGDGSFSLMISTNLIKVETKELSLGEFMTKLRELTETPLKENWMLPRLAKNYNENSRKAQRIVFEDSIVRPLAEAARQKLKSDPGDAESAALQPAALATLIQLEADILSRTTGTNVGTLTPDGAKKFLGALQSYVAGRDLPVDTNLTAVMSWTYSMNDTAKGAWPPSRFAGAKGASKSLAGNPALNAGLEVFACNASNSLQSHLATWDQIVAVRTALGGFSASEKALFDAAAAGSDAKFTEAVRAVEQARKALDSQLIEAAKSPLFASNAPLAIAQQRFRTNVETSAAGALERVRAVNDAAIAAQKTDLLFAEIKVRLDAIQSAVSKRLNQLVSTGDSAAFNQFDTDFIAGRAYQKRSDLYASGANLLPETPFAALPLVGLKGEPLEKFLTNRVASLREAAAAYSGPLKDQAHTALAYFLQRAEKTQSDAFFGAYLAQAKKQLVPAAGFPLVGDPVWPLTTNVFLDMSRLLNHISLDRASLAFSNAFKKYSGKDSPEWKAFLSRTDFQEAMAKALSQDGVLSVCSISLLKMDEPPNPLDDWHERFYNIEIVNPGGHNDKARTATREDTILDPMVMVAPKLTINLYKNALVDNTPLPLKTEAWGPLWLIRTSADPNANKGDRKIWTVNWPVNQPGYKGAIRLQVKFDRPLPALDNWPKQ